MQASPSPGVDMERTVQGSRCIWAQVVSYLGREAVSQRADAALRKCWTGNADGRSGGCHEDGIFPPSVIGLMPSFPFAN